MPCDPVKLPDGTQALVCTRGRRGTSLRKWRCFCGLAGGLQCDWKIGDGATCDVHLCPEHALKVADDKHLCPLHQEAYAKWKTARELREAEA